MKTPLRILLAVAITVAGTVVLFALSFGFAALVNWHPVIVGLSFAGLVFCAVAFFVYHEILS